MTQNFLDGQIIDAHRVQVGRKPAPESVPPEPQGRRSGRAVAAPLMKRGSLFAA